MQKTTFLIAMSIAVIFGLNVNAQQSYPWSVNNAGNQSSPTQVRGQLVSNPVTALLQDETIDEAKQAVDDQAKGYTFGDQKPTAPQNQNSKSETEPALNVQSNAIPENMGMLGCSTAEPGIGCPKSLFGQRNGVQIGGWFQGGYHSENTILFNDRQDNLELHQFWLFADKKTNANNNFGYRIDSVYGIDGPNLQAFGNSPDGAPSGWDNSWDNGAYGWALPQAYLEFGDGDTTVRAGKFLSPFGAERIPSVENFFYSRTYTRVLTEPFSHTGLIYEQRNCNTSYIFGATAGWDTGFDSNSGFNVLTGFRTQINNNVSFQTTSSIGDTGHRGAGILNSFLLNARLFSNVDYGVQFNNLNLSTNRNDEFSLVQYLMYRKSDYFGLGARLEWWKSDQIFPDTKSTWDLTFGANVRPHTNVLIRPEVRFDWGAAAIDPGKANFGIDAIFIF